jgi:hypothetical protein
MKTLLKIMIAASSSTVVFALFFALAQAQLIFLPYFTPTKIEFHGLEDQYPVNGSMTYTISLKGYGSNCIGFTAQTLRKESSLPGGEERVAYFSKTDDCRKISISQGAYNYTRNFSYSGDAVLGEPGDYRIEVEVFDQVTQQNLSDMRAFKVK